jgi:hypothetical protein
MTSARRLLAAALPGSQFTAAPPTCADHLREGALRYGGGAMGQVPTLIRKLRLVLVPAPVALPASLPGVLVILAMAPHVHA